MLKEEFKSKKLLRGFSNIFIQSCSGSARLIQAFDSTDYIIPYTFSGCINDKVKKFPRRNTFKRTEAFG